MSHRAIPRVAVTVFGLLLVTATPAGAEAPPRPLVVGTKATPPFVVRGPGGALGGPSLDLWREIAGELGLDYTLVERDLEGLLLGLEDGTLDLAVAALTVTAAREERIDFTHPFHTTGLAIAIAPRQPEAWYEVFTVLVTPSFLRLLAAFAGLQLVIGGLMWSFERRRNPHFQEPGAARGLLTGLWWAVVTTATVGYGDKVPITGLGRLLAMAWMLVSLIMLTTITASIASSLTVDRLEAEVRGPEDLGKLRVGAIAKATSEIYLRERKLNFTSYPDPEAGLTAIRRGAIDALVHDEPVLRAHLAAAPGGAGITLLPRTFDRQDYAFALPTGSPLREAINRQLAARVGHFSVPGPSLR